MNQKNPTFPFYPSIFVGWDNTPRRGVNGIIILNNSPELFGKNLSQLVESFREKSFQDRLIFINAWNEWAEGNYLEPDSRFGLGFLEKIKSINCL
jgi:lipopolysaccharide biosynthesis protein